MEREIERELIFCKLNQMGTFSNFTGLNSSRSFLKNIRSFDPIERLIWIHTVIYNLYGIEWNLQFYNIENNSIESIVEN